MIKKLLSASLFAAVALSASAAFNVDDYVYTRTAKYQITGANLVVNGQFTEGATGTDGWNPIDETLPVAGNFLWVEAGGPNGQNAVQVATGMNSLTHGMYQKVAVDAAGTYIVSFKVMGAAAGYTDLDLTGGSINYMNAYYNTDEKDSLASCGGTNNTELYYGTEGVNGGYQFSFTADGYTEVNFAVEAPNAGYIIIDFRGMVDGLNIADVCCHAALNVYDDRLANERLDYLQIFLSAEGMTEKDGYDEVVEYIELVKGGLAENASPDEMAGYMEDLNLMWDEYVTANFDEMMELIPTTSGTTGTGNHSANWMNWTTKWNKLSNEYNGTAPWSWSTDRWKHSAGAGNPMGIQWQPGTAGPYDNIATLTATLSAGTYYWGVTANGGTMTKNKYRWARSYAHECAETKLFFNGDTIMIDTLNSARNKDYAVAFELTEDKEVTLGIICNTVVEHTLGFDVQFYDPILYKVKDGGLSEPQKAYLAAVAVQLEALNGRLAVAYGHLAEANDTLPWGKETLQEGVKEAQARYDAWMAMTQEEILACMDNYETLADTIMNNGVRFLNNNYITPFVTLNTPFTNLVASIEAAKAPLAERIYSSSSKRTDLENKIAESQTVYDEKLKVAYSEEEALALTTQKEALDAMVVAFKEAIAATTLVDIDFGTQEAPAVFVSQVDTAGVTYYLVNGAMGTMKFTDIAVGLDSRSWELGYGSATDEAGAVILTDSLGMLRVGNTEAVVNIAGAPVKESDIVNIKFDFYFGNESKKSAGYKVLTAEGDTICGLYCSKYSGTADINTFNVDFNNNITGVGSSAASNSAIAAESNKTSFDIVLDYGARVMYCTTSGTRGTFTSEKIALVKGAPAQFIIYANYVFGARRSWFDNLKVLNIAAEATDAIEVVKAASEKVSNGAMYNIMGQQILKPVKGQIYIQDGVKKIAK